MRHSRQVPVSHTWQLNGSAYLVSNLPGLLSPACTISPLIEINIRSKKKVSRLAARAVVLNILNPIGWFFQHQCTSSRHVTIYKYTPNESLSVAHTCTWSAKHNKSLNDWCGDLLGEWRAWPSWFFGTVSPLCQQAWQVLRQTSSSSHTKSAVSAVCFQTTCHFTGTPLKADLKNWQDHCYTWTQVWKRKGRGYSRYGILKCIWWYMWPTSQAATFFFCSRCRVSL